jgi:outer membrane immunogenic protein
MFRKFLIASAGAVALIGPALAADLPVQPPIYAPPPFSWTGIYLGGQIGYAWDNNNARLFFPTVLLSSLYFNNSPQGVIGGAHVGYNLQINQWVLGVEGSVDGTSLSKSVILSVAGTPATVISRADVQGSIRARGGVAFDRALIYATGGAVFTGIANNYSAFPPNPGFLLQDSVSRTRAGWTVGGGVEYAVTNNWSVRAEYRYADFGHVLDFPFAAFTNGGRLSVDHHLTENQAQVGFSYKFDTFAPTPVVAKY